MELIDFSGVSLDEPCGDFVANAALFLQIASQPPHLPETVHNQVPGGGFSAAASALC
jgi:hypothetical protein